MISPALFSSESYEWATPRNLFDRLNSKYKFTLDVCATKENAKCSRYFTKEDNGLIQNWTGNCWMNPVYGEPEHPCKAKCHKKKCVKRGSHSNVYIPGCIDWMAKASLEVAKGNAFVMCLIPARTDTGWWHVYVEPIRRGERLGSIEFIKGRLKFGDSTNSAPFPSALVAMGIHVTDLQFE